MDCIVHLIMWIRSCLCCTRSPESQWPACSSTQQDADKTFQALQTKLEEGSEGISFIEALAATLKAVLATIKQYQPVITEAFGAPRVVDMVKDVSLALDDKVPPCRFLHAWQAPCNGDKHVPCAYIQVPVIPIGLPGDFFWDHGWHLHVAQRVVHMTVQPGYCDEQMRFRSSQWGLQFPLASVAALCVKSRAARHALYLDARPGFVYLTGCLPSTCHRAHLLS